MNLKSTITVYVCHSSQIDYEKLLYEPLRSSVLARTFQFILPHEQSPSPALSKQVIQSVSIVLAEISYPSTGQGIELGWANSFNVPICCIHQQGCSFSSSIPLLTNTIFAYQDGDDIIHLISSALASLNGNYEGKPTL